MGVSVGWCTYQVDIVVITMVIVHEAGVMIDNTATRMMTMMKDGYDEDCCSSSSMRRRRIDGCVWRAAVLFVLVTHSRNTIQVID